MTLWERAQLAITLLAIDPQRLGGLVIRARAGPAQAAMLAAVQALNMPKVKLQHHMTPEVLNGDIDLSVSLAEHRLVMRNLYWYGLIIAGLFNFLPGRSTNALFFDEREELGLWVLGAGLALLAANAMRQKRRLSTHSKFPLEKPAPMV